MNETVGVEFDSSAGGNKTVAIGSVLGPSSRGPSEVLRVTDVLSNARLTASRTFSRSSSWMIPERSPPGGSGAFSYLESMSRSWSLTCTSSATALDGGSLSLTEVCAEVPTYLWIPSWIFVWTALPATGTRDTGPNRREWTAVIIGTSVGAGVLIAGLVVCIVQIRRSRAAPGGTSDDGAAPMVVPRPLPGPEGESYDATTGKDGTGEFTSEATDPAVFEDFDEAYLGFSI